MIGKILNQQYRVDQFIGRGGMADVYKVWDLDKNVHLAIKVLHSDLAEDKIFQRRFAREANTLAELQHPHIVRFYGQEQDDYQTFLVMDFVDGKTLRSHIYRNGKSLPDNEINRIMNAVCSALQYAHNRNLIHCDLKPANIMLSNYGQVLLMDFGITRMAEATTATLVGAGTPAYMAPEQIRGEEPVFQTDVYALGVILYEMLTGGERPFTGDNADTTGTTRIRILWEQMHLEPPSPRKFNPAISLELESVVLRCLQKDPEKRYTSALEFYSALEAALGNEMDVAKEVDIEDWPETDEPEFVPEPQPEPKSDPGTISQPPQVFETDIYNEPVEEPRPIIQQPTISDQEIVPPDVYQPKKAGMPKWIWGVGGIVLVVFACIIITIMLGLQIGNSEGNPIAVLISSNTPTRTSTATNTETPTITITPTVTISPTVTNSPSKTPTGTRTVTNTPTKIPTVTKVLLSADWNQFDPHWEEGVSSGGSGEYFYTNGGFEINILVENQAVAYIPLSSGIDQSNVIIEADIYKKTGDDGSGAGFICRDNNETDSDYRAYVYFDGHYKILKQLYGEYSTIAEYSFDSAINTGNEINHIELHCLGNTISLYANGKLLTSVEDYDVNSGDISLIARTPKGFENTSVIFDNLVVSSADYLLLSADWNAADPNWPDYSYDTGGKYIESGGYYLMYVYPPGYQLLSYPENFLDFVSDITIEADVILAEGDNQTKAGFICRNDLETDSYYQGKISFDGEYTISKNVEGDYSVLTSAYNTSVINTENKTNHIEFQCIGNSIKLIVNGIQLATIEDQDNQTGYFGLYMASPSEIGDSYVFFDNLVVGSPNQMP